MSKLNATQPSLSECPSTEHQTSTQAADDAHRHEPRKLSMHEGVEVWDGCGSCGAEPYWLEIGAEIKSTERSDEESER
ncbi:hypothetical protein G3480_12445 [Thiorhodococcus mannitoliphagus]|uniref:Uncharacterized protein n=1 Tax=Thiorhodococcus mannitoliphagus TaxID=329406 RepID=A0A6P1DVT1_9GAMM|nr:hypothetical protein [Thiorhodococcus mannitoliphagus]NEX21111.1 hypothetical protein [Thiorhodococcus mannitoliphagus]